jgi:hypothetical protein
MNMEGGFEVNTLNTSAWVPRTPRYIRTLILSAREEVSGFLFFVVGVQRRNGMLSQPRKHSDGRRKEASKTKLVKNPGSTARLKINMGGGERERGREGE